MRVLILGLSGQDGSYLAEQMLAGGHDVFGVVRRPRPGPTGAHLLTADLLDQDSLERALRQSRPDVIYNLAAVTAPGGAWGTTQPPLLAAVTGLGVVRLLEAMLKVAPDARLVHASSSAIYDPHRYGLYGIAKQFAHQAVLGYRDRLHCSNAVLYSHTSPRQDPRFLARRITTAAARIAAGYDERIHLTDPDSRRDWGDARDVAGALARIATTEPSDIDVATGTTHIVRDLVDVALRAAGIAWNDAVTIEPGPPAPTEVPADLTAVRRLGWAPRYTFADTITSMVRAEAARHADRTTG